MHRSLISKFSLKIPDFFAVFSPKFRKFCQNFAEFSPNLTNFFRDSSKMQHFSKIFKMCNIFLGIFSKNCRFFRKKAEFSGHETAKKVIVSITYRASCTKILAQLCCSAGRTAARREKRAGRGERDAGPHGRARAISVRRIGKGKGCGGVSLLLGSN